MNLIKYLTLKPLRILQKKSKIKTSINDAKKNSWGGGGWKI